MLILKPNEALSQWNTHLKASLAKAHEYYPTTLEASNALHYGENRVVFSIWNAHHAQQNLFGKIIDKIKVSALGERTVNAIVAQKPLLQLEMKLPPVVFAALWAKRNPSYGKLLGMNLVVGVGFIENEDITHVLSDAAANELARGISLPALRAASELDSSAGTKLLAPEAMSKKDAFHRQFIALRKAQPYAPLKKHTLLIRPHRVLFAVWNTKTKKCVVETRTEVSPLLFDALWAKRDSIRCVVTEGVQQCLIDEYHVTTIFQAAVQAAVQAAA